MIDSAVAVAVNRPARSEQYFILSGRCVVEQREVAQGRYRKWVTTVTFQERLFLQEITGQAAAIISSRSSRDAR